MEYLQYGVNDTGMKFDLKVLNLVISGIPSIQCNSLIFNLIYVCFKPCYKWNTFNTIYTNYSKEVYIEF